MLHIIEFYRWHPALQMLIHLVIVATSLMGQRTKLICNQTARCEFNRKYSL
jgi:hypothetical protein